MPLLFPLLSLLIVVLGLVVPLFLEKVDLDSLRLANAFLVAVLLASLCATADLDVLLPLL